MTSDWNAAPPGFRGIVEALNNREVQYVVIGGLSAILHGASLPRTLDVDVTPASDAENKRRLASALRDLDAKLRAPGLEEPFDILVDERMFRGMTTMTFTTRLGPFDVCFVPDGTGGYEDLVRSAIVIDVAGTPVPVASLEDVIRSKMAAGREKDAQHLDALTDAIERRRRGEY
ncbi:MAG: hypothetical protein M3323_11020 [Actinomycetota bacterium]|nr:hypothetical protein [Actinomycetota bacterium]